MIKVFGVIRVHWLFFVLMTICIILKKTDMFFINYTIMLIHETAHFLASKAIGLSVDGINIYPFGVQLSLKNTILYSISDEIILYMSGPFINIVIALFMLPFVFGNEYLYDIYLKNISLFLINILPIIPLDGGMIIKKILNHKFGYNAANRIMKGISVMFSVLFFSLAAALVYNGVLNVSMMIFLIFLAGYLLFSKEKYNYDLIKELSQNRKRDKTGAYNAKVIGAYENTPLISVARLFNFSSNYFVFLTDKNGNIIKIIGEEEVIQKLLNEKIT